MPVIQKRKIQLKQKEMRHNEFVKYRDLAKELCEDFKPLRVWTSEDIEYIWMNESQLKKFVESIIESVTKTEKQL